MRPIVENMILPGLGWRPRKNGRICAWPFIFTLSHMHLRLLYLFDVLRIICAVRSRSDLLACSEFPLTCSFVRYIVPRYLLVTPLLFSFLTCPKLFASSSFSSLDPSCHSPLV